MNYLQTCIETTLVHFSSNWPRGSCLAYQFRESPASISLLLPKFLSHPFVLTDWSGECLRRRKGGRKTEQGQERERRGEMEQREGGRGPAFIYGCGSDLGLHISLTGVLM